MNERLCRCTLRLFQRNMAVFKTVRVSILFSINVKGSFPLKRLYKQCGHCRQGAFLHQLQNMQARGALRRHTTKIKQDITTSNHSIKPPALRSMSVCSSVPARTRAMMAANAPGPRTGSRSRWLPSAVATTAAHPAPAMAATAGVGTAFA
jgi:hypothetical protein